MNTRSLLFLGVAMLAQSCIFGGPPDPTLELQPPPPGTKFEFQVLDSSVEPGEAYLKLTFVNRTSRPVVADRKLFVLTDGTTQWTPKTSSRSTLTVQPGETSAKLKLSYKGVPGGQPAYELMFPVHAFREGSDSGPNIPMPTLRLVVKKPAE